MKLKKLILIFIAFLQLNTVDARAYTTLINHDISAKFNHQLNGYYPSIEGNQFNEINNIILKFIETNFDTKQSISPTEVSYKKIFENNDFLSLSIDYNISNTTERYFKKYYTFNLSKGKEISANEYLDYKKIPKANVVNEINNFIAPCISNRKISPNYCLDMTIQNLIENKTQVNYSDISGFFIKNTNELGFGFNSNKFTTTFIYNVKTKKVHLA